MCRKISGWIFTVCFHALLSTSKVIEAFDEELVINPLRDGRVSTRFAFTTVLENATPRNPGSLGQDDQYQHYQLFPLALGQILREYAVTELHLSLNAGKWNYESWGYPYEASVGTGAELWTWMGDSSHTSIDERWLGLKNALSGLFCASVGSLDEQRTTSPVQSFKPEGDLPNWGLPHQLRHATLPSEHVCTENLTPFLKLLPCKGSSGLASLLNPHKLFDADWHGMGVHVVWTAEGGVSVRLTFQAVFDPVRASIANLRRDWSFGSVFGRSINDACSVARSARVFVGLPVDELYQLTPEPDEVKDNNAHYDILARSDPLDINMRWRDEFTYSLDKPDTPLIPLSIRRTLHGSSQARGELSVLLTNHLSDEIQTRYLETMPWLLQFYLHTLKATVNGQRRKDVLSNISYALPVAHARPATLESIITLPGNSTTHITMGVSKAFLRYTEHPPDAQRGWDLPPAVFIPLNALGSYRVGRIYTPTLLVDLATPDFSMPYNVIIFSCSLIAFIFGSIFNALTRRFVIVPLEPPTPRRDDAPPPPAEN